MFRFIQKDATKQLESLTNGADASPTNVTITSSIGDITVDSVRDHLNSTVTTLHTTTTEEIVGKNHCQFQLFNSKRILSNKCKCFRSPISAEYANEQYRIIDTTERHSRCQ